MDTKRFNEEHAAKSRAVCERIEREDAERKSKLGDLMDAQIKGELGRAKAEADGWRKIAERRLKHTDECEAALAKRNERIAELEKQVADLRAELANAKVLSGRERQILDMWPRFKDGEYVWYGDAYTDADGYANEVSCIAFYVDRIDLVGREGFHTGFEVGERVKRPAPKVLDADGVEIEVGDTVYAPRMYGDNSFTVSRLTKNRDGRTLVMVEEMGSGLFPETVTHTRTDSWERLEEDAKKGVCEYAGAYRKSGTIDSHECDGCRFDAYGVCPTCEQQMALDIVRRAKALAGAEVE